MVSHISCIKHLINYKYSYNLVQIFVKCLYRRKNKKRINKSNKINNKFALETNNLYGDVRPNKPIMYIGRNL